MSFEEDREGNLCLIAYPLKSEPAADLENKDPLADCKPISEMHKWGTTMASSMLLDSENYGKDGRSRHSTKDMENRWDETKSRSSNESLSHSSAYKLN